ISILHGIIITKYYSIFRKMTGGFMIIRSASLVDAEGISKVHVDSWRTTYENIVPKEYLDNLSYSQRTELWKRNIGDKKNFVIVAENNGGQIIGFADAWKRENNN